MSTTHHPGRSRRLQRCPSPLRPRPAARRRQRGQALAEMAILAAVLVPMFLLVPILGKYSHVRQTTHQAARAAAWEATVVHDYEWTKLSRAEQEMLLLDRHFARADAPITSVPASAAASDRLGNPMLNTFSDRELVKRAGVTLAPYRNESAGAVMKLLEGAGGVIESLPGEFPPNKDGLVTASLDVAVENLTASDGSPATWLTPFDRLNVTMSSSHTVLADTWSAAGNGVEGEPSHSRKRSVHEQVSSLVPSSMLGGAAEVLENLDALELLPVIGTVSRLRPGYIEPDIVPVDRLQPYTP